MSLKILYVCHAPDTLGGAALSLYDLIFSVKDNVEPFVLLQYKGVVSDFFMKSGIKCLFFPFLGGIKPPSFVRRIGRKVYEETLYKKKVTNFARKLEKYNFDIIHSNSSAITIGYELSCILEIKHVWHVREFLDLDFGFTPAYGWKKLKEAIALSSASIFITQAVYEHFMKGETNNAFVLWDAVRSIGNKVVYPKEKFFIHTAANLSVNKGTNLAVKSFVSSLLWKDGYKLFLAGNISSKFKDELLSKLPELSKQSIVFLGYVSELTELLSKASGFLMCSKNEGLGRVSIEAMFCGCPVIGFNSAGTKELLCQGHGYLVDSVEQCADVMKDINKTCSLERLEECQSFAQKSFSIDEYGKKILSIYNNLKEGNNASI